ncbi:hypothetical protein INR49_018016, partial [Caranx melampygus]
MMEAHSNNVMKSHNSETGSGQLLLCVCMRTTQPEQFVDGGEEVMVVRGGGRGRSFHNAIDCSSDLIIMTFDLEDTAQHT